MSFFRKQVNRIGAQPVKYRFNLVVHQAYHLPDNRGPLYVEWNRHKKSLFTKKVMPLQDRRAVWDECIPIVSTLYKDSKGVGYQVKNAKLFLRDPNRIVGTIHLNMSDFAQTSGVDIPLDLELEEYSKRPKPRPTIKVTITPHWLKDYQPGDARQSDVSDLSYMQEIDESGGASGAAEPQTYSYHQQLYGKKPEDEEDGNDAGEQGEDAGGDVLDPDAVEFNFDGNDGGDGGDGGGDGGD